MKIIHATHNDHLTLGLASAMTAIGHDVLLWDKRSQPSFDMFDDHKPDILVVYSEDVDEGLVAASLEFTDTKVVVVGTIVHPRLNISLICYPNHLNQRTLELLNQNTARPYIQIKPAANLAQFNKGEYNPKLASELFYIASPNAKIDDIYPYMSPNLDYNLKIVGPQKFMVPEYLGTASTKTLSDMLKSTEIGVDTDGEDCYNYIANKIFCLSSVLPDMLDSLSAANIEKYLGAPKLRKKMVEAKRVEILEKDTYFHRTAQLLTALGYEEDANKSIDMLGKIE